MAQYKLKNPKSVEKTVVGAYKKIEETVVRGYRKIENKFIETFLEEDKEKK